MPPALTDTMRLKHRGLLGERHFLQEAERPESKLGQALRLQAPRLMGFTAGALGRGPWWDFEVAPWQAAWLPSDLHMASKDRLFINFFLKACDFFFRLPQLALFLSAASRSQLKGERQADHGEAVQVASLGFHS